METRTGLGAVDPGELLASRAYNVLREAILSNRLASGKRLSVPQLARQLELSRSPVREAVQRLIFDGLAVHIPHRGAAVARADVEDLRQLYVVREVLEGLAARLACERLDDAAVERLGEILHQHQAAIARGADESTHIDFDIRFHTGIRELTGNRHLNDMLARAQGRSHLALHSLWRGERAREMAIEEHRRILEALATRQCAAAESAARAHVVGIAGRVEEATRTSPASPRSPALEEGGGGDS
jgi:DNA-binding GntR family transcriptional regulator